MKKVQITKTSNIKNLNIKKSKYKKHRILRDSNIKNSDITDNKKFNYQEIQIQ